MVVVLTIRREEGVETHSKPFWDTSHTLPEDDQESTTRVLGLQPGFLQELPAWVSWKSPDGRSGTISPGQDAHRSPVSKSHQKIQMKRKDQEGNLHVSRRGKVKHFVLGPSNTTDRD
jgi:hypothetical protein